MAAFHDYGDTLIFFFCSLHIAFTLDSEIFTTLAKARCLNPLINNSKINLSRSSKACSKNFTNLRIDISIYDDGDCEMVLFGEREETPGEVKYRLSQEEQSLKLQREMELRQLELLKKKYEQ